MKPTNKRQIAGWISPGGKYFRLEHGLQFHANWLDKHIEDVNKEAPHTNLSPLHGSMQRMKMMYEAGWVKKDDHDHYTAKPHSGTLNTIRGHMREHAPKHKEFTLDAPYNVYSKTYPVNEALLLITKKLNESVSSSRKSIRTGVRAWISPEGTVHPLASLGNAGPGYHPEWVTSNLDKIHKKHIAYSGGMFDKVIDRQETMRKMMMGGWIKKDTPNKYQTGHEFVKRAAEHFLSHHPNRYSHATIIAHKYGGDQQRYTVSREGELRKE